VKKLFLILILVTLGACSNEDKKPPKGIYDTQQIAVFLKDLYILEMKVKELRLSEDSTKKVFAYYEQELYKKHNLSDSIYHESFKHYINDIQGLSKIYEIVVDSLSLEERIETVMDTTENDLQQE